ncbi:sulfur carrier protein ThiS [Caulifigura coniformis]|uniref:Sulfur carrier protein ThiS n=1 Tax=Caulifigura coniformis TaxID=2527983 RepID=A0A517SF44_9PLAN|nr:sulfur carrier protein ThiS [Caulifigura coniformis]QDT54753.1 sulfur carrier protein ThiS [Caulifigura coniformis]
MSSEMISISVNGQSREVARGMTLAALVAELKVPSKFVAVERNRDVVPRAQHAETLLQAGDQLEVVTLVGGG